MKKNNKYKRWQIKCKIQKSEVVKNTQKYKRKIIYYKRKMNFIEKIQKIILKYLYISL